jgi:transcriptional regulator with XRE-family HTH domain
MFAYLRTTFIFMHITLMSKAEILALLGMRLRDQRLAQNLAQSTLADMAGVSLGALRNLEKHGRCSLETLVAVVQALGLSGELENLFGLRRQSIAQMEQAEAAGRRQRASKRKS